MKWVNRMDQSDKREYRNMDRREWMDNDSDESDNDRLVIEMIL